MVVFAPAWPLAVLGFTIVGAVLTGVVGQDSLRIGFAVPMVLVLAMLPLARAFAPPSAAAPAPSTT